MAHSRRFVDALCEYLERHGRVVEVGIGRRTDLAAALAERGVSVTAVDVHDRPVPESVAFVRDDVFDPDLEVYAGAGAIYALNLPPELHRPTLAIARAVDAEFAFTTLGGDQPAVLVERKAVPGDTLYLAVPPSRGGELDRG